MDQFFIERWMTLKNFVPSEQTGRVVILMIKKAALRFVRLKPYWTTSRIGPFWRQYRSPELKLSLLITLQVI